MRLDQALVEQGLCESRARAQDLIGQGHVLVNGQPARKSSQKISQTDMLSLSGEQHPWVSRGGMKLAHALEHWGIDAADAIALDVGASTGGFTDVLLHQGAAQVFAVDVGRDQLHVRLREDVRVVNMEGTNARDLVLEEAVSIIVCDASFISIRLVLDSVLSNAQAGAMLVTLIKPQFEVGKDKLPKDGVVKEESEQQRVCDEIEAWLKAKGWDVQGIIDSPILGPKGNKEFLLHAIMR